ncbi:retrotransposable element Tf2 [Tanacetum coccineum]
MPQHLRLKHAKTSTKLLSEIPRYTTYGVVKLSEVLPPHHLPSSNGKTTIFVMVDRLSKYAHFVPLSRLFTGAQIAQVFLDNVYKLHGFPKVIVNGQAEVANRCLECYLRCMSSEKPKAWAKWVSLAKYWYNTTYHTSLKTTTYEVLYGQPPPNPIAYVQGQCKRVYDPVVTVSFGKWVYLKLQPYRQVFVRLGKYVLHVSQLKKYKGPIPNSTAVLPQCNVEEEFICVPVAILDRKLGKVRNSAQVYGLVQWSNGTLEDAM